MHSIEETTVPALRALIEHEAPNAVVWAAGAGAGGAGRTESVDRDGAIRVMDALAAAEYTTQDGLPAARRLVLVSAVDVRDREKGVPEWYSDQDKERSGKVWGAIGAYMQAKLAADTELVRENENRRLRYTIVRPGGLTNNEGTGRVQVGRVGLQETVSREDVAAVVAEVLKRDDTVGLAFDVLGDGKEGRPIEDAIEYVARERVDTFEGFH